MLSVAGGFFLASKGHVDLAIFLAAMIGTSLVVASGCVFNNCIDRDIDIKMERTKNRVLVQGLISLKLALLFATVLGIAGVVLLYKVANPLAALFAVIGDAYSQNSLPQLAAPVCGGGYQLLPVAGCTER